MYLYICSYEDRGKTFNPNRTDPGRNGVARFSIREGGGGGGEYIHNFFIISVLVIFYQLSQCQYSRAGNGQERRESDNMIKNT